MRLLVLSDCLLQSHSFWIRIGQYLEELSDELSITLTDNIKVTNDLKRGDKLLIYRHQTEWGDIVNILKKLRRIGVVIISDIDDYLWYDGLKRGWSKWRLRCYTKALKHTNIITCSTKELQQILKIMFKNQKIIIIENSANKYMKNKSTDSNRIRVGWTGAPWTRPEDLEIIKPLAKWLVQERQDFEIVHIGHHEKMHSMATFLGIKEEYVEKIGLMSHADYSRSIDFDIGLAPLTNECFNQYKSPIKVIEYSSLGIPWIASDTITYRQLCEEWGYNGRLCRKPDEWITNLKLLTNKDIRKEEGRILKYNCDKKSGFKRGVREWRALLTVQCFE